MQQPEVLITTPFLDEEKKNHLRDSSSSSNIFTRNRLLSTTSTDTTVSSHPDDMDNKRSFTIENLATFGQSTESLAADLTPSAAIREKYYRSSHYLSDDALDEEDLLGDEDTVYEEAAGDVFDYRPGESQPCAKKPNGAPSISSVSGSVFSLRTEYNEDSRSINSIRTVDDRLQGRSTSILGTNLNTLAAKTAKKVSRSSSIFRTNSLLSKNNQKKFEPFVPIREQQIERDNTSLRSVGGTSLLSKLSKSTAPMRAKLSAFSHFSKHVQNDRHQQQQQHPLALPGKKRFASSVFNMPISSPSSSNLHQPPIPSSKRALSNEKAHSFSFIPKTLSASSSTNSISSASTNGNTKAITGTTLVDEPLAFVKENVPNIYPAFLSQVAESFKDRILLNTRIKDSIKYKDVFTGQEAVDKLALLIKSDDRNLALLLGRALDAQKFFHDVYYEHRLRDSAHELYQFRADPMLTIIHPEESASSLVLPVGAEEDALPTGVFTLLTDCYSPTCTRENLCYSARCPRRQEQTKHQHEKGHRRSESYSINNNQQEERLWINTVPSSILNTLSKDEKKRQENIFELVYTEKDFVDDLKYIKELWIEPLFEESEQISSTSVHDIFWNILEVLQVNEQLSESLLERQSKDSVVNQVGDIMLAHVANFEPFVRYGAHQIIGKYEFEREKSTNPWFADFVNKTERLPQSRKLELNGYLTKPTTRLGRYNLLLREILKHTPKDHPDQETIPRVMSIIARFLADVNKETGKTENAFNLKLLDDNLINKNISNFDLELTAPNRQLIMKGTWKRGSGSESSEVLVYLLDHCLLIVKPKQNDKYKLYKKPIPLALLSITFPDYTKRASTIIPLGRPSNVSGADITHTTTNHTLPPNSTTSNTNTASNAGIINHTKNGYPVSFVHLGKQNSGGPTTLYATTLATRKQWADKIEGQRKTLVEKHKVFNVKPINESFFSTFNKVNCIAVFDNGRSLVLGGDQGVYLKKEGSGDELIRILAMDKVSQIDILEQSNLIIVLADKILYTYTLDTLLWTEAGIKRGRKLSSHVSYFKVGQIWDKSDTEEAVERTLVCFVRYNAMSSTIRALEPCETTKEHSKKRNKMKFLRGNNEALKVYRDLYIPGEASSIQFFKNVICVGSQKGFEMVNLNSAEVQSVLDPNDENNNSLLSSNENMKPISMLRHKNGDILLCYSELAFYIDKKGRRVRTDWSISWEGNPSAFVFRFPYIVAFNTNFIEVRHMDTGDLLQVIPGNNIRCLCPDSTDRIFGVMDDRLAGSEVVFELELVDPYRRKKSMIKNSVRIKY